MLELHKKSHFKYSVERKKSAILYEAIGSMKEIKAKMSCASQFCKRKQAGSGVMTFKLKTIQEIVESQSSILQEAIILI